ncbi:MAG: methylmalonyl-CoA epimerase [Aggregatilineales bacterium]
MTSKIKINHIAVAVPDIDAALPFWRDALGLPYEQTDDVPTEAVKVAFLAADDAHIELVQPTTDDSGIAKYLAKRGAGMHHLCFEVEDIEAAMQQLTEHDVELINETPRQRDNGTRYAFVHPKSTGGVMIELYETPKNNL